MATATLIELIKAVFYGIIEGITEWLPISSTGHLILFERFFNFNSSKEFIEMYRVVIQFGAIFAVVLLFFGKIWPFGWHSASKHSNNSRLGDNDKLFLKKCVFKTDIFNLWIKIIVACIPTIIYAVLFDDKVSALLSSEIGSTGIAVEFLVVIVMLVLVGAVFIIIENKNRGKTPKIETALTIPYKEALLIGVFQLAAAALPGTSRSGATILGALMLGVSRAAAAEFTFYLAIPVMFGASLWKGYKFLGSGAAMSSTELAVLIVGMVVAFAVSIFVIRFLMGFIKKHDFKVFGWYRIVLGAVLIVYFLITVLKVA